MNFPNSLYEAIIQGFSGSGEVAERRAMFLFLVDHSEAMQKDFMDTGKNRLECVIEALNTMKAEMATADSGNHLDLGFIGYPAKGTETLTMDLWPENGSACVIRPVNCTNVVERAMSNGDNDEGTRQGLDHAKRLISEWCDRNPNPLFPPTVIHVFAGERAEVAGIEPCVKELVARNETQIFHCCLDERAMENIHVPQPHHVSSGLSGQLYPLSSDMPPLVEDIGELMCGRVSPRLRRVAEEKAQNFGVPRGLASLGADLLAGAMAGGLRLPAGRPGYTYGVHARVDGLRIDSSKGFALVNGMVGFQIFTKLFN